ncbi:MAG TPA: 4-amino-4-deoxy-L-arabinose transferase [Parvularcula sp.]|nr:4-amino-4-deoxy-L-arabinose transferase [Parvularcula sp.]
MTTGSFLTDRAPFAAARRLGLIALVAALAGIVGAFSLPPLDRDEARFAQAAAQMLESGDFIVIRFQEDERNKKPAGAYWLQAASVAAFSEPEARAIWAWRLPSILGAALAAVFTYCAIARLTDPAAGLLAALLLAASPVFAAESFIAKTDALLLACVTGAAAALAHLLSAAHAGKRPGLWSAMLFWVAIGAGVLIKGPIIILVIAPAILMIAWRFPETRPLTALRPLPGILILTLMIGPWAFAIAAATEGRFFTEAVGADMLAKVGAAQESHGGPPGYYLALAPFLAWPLIALAPAGLYAAFEGRRAFPVWFLLSWLAPGWLIFELTATKLPHYVLPMLPALAGLCAITACNAPSSPRALWRMGAAVYALAGLALAAAVAGAPVAFGLANVAAIIAAAILAALTLFAAARFWQGDAPGGAAIAAPAGALLALTLLGGVLPSLTPLAVAPRLSAALDRAGLHALRDGAAPTALAGFHEPSAVFLLGTQTRLGDGAAAADALIDTGGAAVVETRELAAFVARLTARNARAERVADIAGFNYSKGDAVTLTIFKKAESAPAP